eukprot:4941562-Alexandrium_andersonii.AAC.1
MAPEALSGGELRKTAEKVGPIQRPLNMTKCGRAPHDGRRSHDRASWGGGPPGQGVAGLTQANPQ